MNWETGPFRAASAAFTASGFTLAFLAFIWAHDYKFPRPISHIKPGDAGRRPGQIPPAKAATAGAGPARGAINRTGICWFRGCYGTASDVRLVSRRLLLALNATCASHSVRGLGALRANLGRLLVALLILGLFAHTVGHGFASASLGWFLLSGLIGMGLGDLGVYSALPLLGSRLTVLMTQCLAAPIAAFGEWLWLDTRLTSLQLVWGLVILVGVAVALMPSAAHPPRVQIQPVGFLFGLLAAAGQGFGALISRKGVTAAAAAGEHVANATFGLNAAYHRILAGVVFTALWFLVRHLLRRNPPAPVLSPAARRPALRG